MKISIYFSALFLFFTISCKGLKATEGPIYIFEWGKRVSSGNRYNHLLITGQGTSGTRLFMGKLAVSLNLTFAKEGIKTTYEYLGADSILAAQEIAKYKSAGTYDGFLNLVQKDETNKAVYIGQSKIGIPQAAGNSYNYVVRYKQLIKIELLNRRNEITADATMQLNFDLRKDYYYQTLANKITAHMVKQK